MEIQHLICGEILNSSYVGLHICLLHKGYLVTFSNFFFDFVERYQVLFL